MAHTLTHKISTELVDRTSGKIASDAIISAEAVTIHQAYVADDRITGVQVLDLVNAEDGEPDTFTQVIMFSDSATCDAYLAEMAAIDEVETSGASRSEQVRADV